MKNVHILLLLLFIACVGIMVPIQPTNAWGGDEPFATECYHVSDGVRDPTPYTLLIGAGVCPPCSSVSACSNSVEHTLHKSTPSLPPEMCAEVGIPEW